MRTCRRLAQVKAQRCLQHRQRAPDGELKSEPVAVTTQEAVDGHCEKAMKIASVEQIELGNIMELSITGQVLRWARQSNLSGGVSLRRADGWNLKSHSRMTVARHLREKIHPSILVVTIREGEERWMCSASLRELFFVKCVKMFCFPFSCTKLQCVLSCRTSNTFWFLPCHLSLALCLPGFFPASLPPLPPFSFQF